MPGVSMQQVFRGLLFVPLQSTVAELEKISLGGQKNWKVKIRWINLLIK